jgi:hypothetical protein
MNDIKACVEKKQKNPKSSNGALMRVEKCVTLFNAPLVAWPAA